MAEPVLNIYLVTSPNIYRTSYDEYDSFVVCCETEQEARETLPGGQRYIFDKLRHCWADTFSGRVYGTHKYNTHGWVLGLDIDALRVERIGLAAPETRKGVILSSFNAG
ncbi:MAG: hypothetical protein AABZ74_02025 [Cyanobacteriota bacterium]